MEISKAIHFLIQPNNTTTVIAGNGGKEMQDTVAIE
jgi:hypothetical protein